jgi:predicted MFS family arabinose efflux permease
VHGAVTGSFATRIPWIADHLHTGVGGLGIVLTATAIGAVGTMPLAAYLAHRYPSRTIVRILICLWAAALALPALAPNLPVLAVVLLFYGAAAGTADVAMNAQGIVVEEKYGRSIMSSLHGMWSVGALGGSAVGALAAHAGVDARLHLGITAAVLVGIGSMAAGGLLNTRPPDDTEPVDETVPAFALPSPQVLLIGLVGFCAIFAEGAGNDWCAVYLKTVTGADPGVAASAFTGFALTMAVARLAGDRVIRRVGAVNSVRISGAVATLGGVLILLAREPVLAIAGFALVGLGIAIVVPLAFAAAARVGPNAAHALAGVATISYGAGMAAPGAIGGIAAVSSLSVSFLVVTALCLAMGLGAVALRPHDDAMRADGAEREAALAGESATL